MSDPKNHRRKLDIMKLIENQHDTTVSDDMRFLVVKFHGPIGTPYEGGIWRVHVFLPEDYPFRSPSVGFERNKIYHPNVDLHSGSVCLDIINQKWSPLYGLVNIFETFLPQLLRYPNPDDPLNHAAAALMVRDISKFKKYAAKFVQKHAAPEHETETQIDVDSEISDLSSGDEFE